MIITFCGSIKFLKEMIALRDLLESMGHKVLLPERAEYWVSKNDSTETKSPKMKKELIMKHLELIKSSDAILVINLDKSGKKNYIGGNTFLEMGFALAFEKEIYVLNKLPYYSSYYDELKGMLPIVINGDLSKIKKK